MPRFAANLTMLFTEYPFLERFDRAAEAGFTAVEFLFPYDEDVAAIEQALKRNSLTQVLFNLPAGNFASGERGMANDPRRIDEFQDGVKRALEIAARLDCRQLNCLVGLELDTVAYDTQFEIAIENLRYAADLAQSAGVRQLVEPLNSIETPGYLLTSTADALDLLDDCGHENLWIQYDVYHMQRMEGNLTATLREQIGRIAHIQVADSPARNQPGTGEINYPFIFNTLDEIGYDGWVSAEYKPAPDTLASLQWFNDWKSRT
ncbi:MAG TPA: hydroxypyruvate isomerase [Nitrolancea sp.]|jgi:hydroxypyruvate isomerase|nr:hydroxypyruvate isomerase [Nitrolancea sp.]